jgi:hypothetical protein
VKKIFGLRVEDSNTLMDLSENRMHPSQDSSLVPEMNLQGSRLQQPVSVLRFDPLI